MHTKYTSFLFSILFSVCAFAQPTNDDCANSTPITIPASGNICVNGTLAGATDDGIYSGCETAGSNEVWFTYIATGSNNTVTVSPTGGTPATNLVVNITSSACGVNTLNTCNAAATANGTATASWAYPTGTQVWIFVSSTTGSTGTFQVCVNSTTTPPSTGKDCTTAVPICNNNPFTAPVAAGSNGYQPPCFAAALQQPIIFQFTVGQTGLLNWRAVPTCGAPHANATEFDWAVYNITSGCPGTAVACNYNYTGSFFGNPSTTAQGMQGGPGAGCNNTAASGNVALELCTGVTVTAGQTYIIILDQYTTGNSCSINFDFNGSTFQLAPSSLFTVNPGTGCGTVNVNFTNTSVGTTGQTWSFGDGTTSTVVSPPAKTYSTPGTYLVSLTTTSASGCTDVSSQSVQVFETPVLTVTKDTICSGQQATLTATSTTGGGTYSWSPGGFNTASITVSPSSNTTYTVTYTSADNCTASATTSVTIQTATFTVNAGPDSTICANQTIQLNGTVNPTGSYTYSWSPAASLTNSTSLTPAASPAANTTYMLSVTDANGCTRSDSLVVTINGVAVPVNASISPTVICPGQQVQLDANILPTGCGPTVLCGGNTLSGIIGSGTTNQPGTATQPPTLLGNFNKSGRNQMLYTATELLAALGGPSVIRTVSFNIGIFNSNAFLQNFVLKMTCTNATSLNTWENNLTTVFTSAALQPVANWNNFNLSTPFAWDGVSNIIIDICWNNPSTFGNQNNKAQCATTAFNSYLYSIANTDQCGTATPPTVSTLRPNLRFNYCVPDITTYTLAWTPGTGANAVANPTIHNTTANPLTSQSYTISVSGGGCVGSDVVSVQVDTSRLSAGADISSCPSYANNLTATVTGTVIPGPATFAWTTLSGTSVGNTQTVSVSPATNTSYVVTMNGGACVKKDTVNVTITGLTVNTTRTNVTCNAANNGKIFVTSNGNAPYSYVWSANANTLNKDSAVSLPPGNYSVTVTDATGCTGSATASITEPTVIAFTQVITNVYCFGGNNGVIALSPSGGTPPYNFAWSNAAPNNDTIFNLTQGNYSVTITDANSCNKVGNFNVSAPSQLTFNPVQIKDARCFNGNDGYITVSASGGTGTLSYNWSHDAALHTTTANGLSAGNYTVTVIDASNCTASITYTVSQPATGLTLNPTTTTSVTCFGGNNGTATANPNGGVSPYSYAWNTVPAQATQTATGLLAQSYQVTVTDDSLCTASATVSISQPAQITMTGNVTNVSCNGNSDAAVDITVTNGVPTLSYLWSTNAASATTQDIQNVPFGTYTVTVTDNTLCTASASFNVSQPAALVLNPATITNVSCFGGNNGSIASSATGGTGAYTYNWAPSGNTATLSSLIAGTYDLTVTDANGCTTNSSYVVTEPAAALAFAPAVVTDVLCNGLLTGAISVSVSGGTGAYTYSWSQNAGLNSANATGLGAGTYIVTVTDANGCSLSSSNTVIEPSAITFGANTLTNVSCNGGNDGAATVSPSGGTGTFNYTWNGIAGTNPQTGLAAGNYTVVVTDANNCTASVALTITQPAAITISPIVQNALCAGAPNGSIDANPSGGNQPFVFNWSDPSAQSTQTAIGLAAGSYSVTVTDNTGCSASAFATVNEPADITLNIQTVQVKCPGDLNGSISVTANGGTPGYTYTATPDGINLINSPDGNFQNLASGYYGILVTDANGCSKTDTAFIPAPVADVITYTVDSTSCYGNAYQDGAVHVMGNTIQNMPYQFSIDGGGFAYSGDLYNLSAGSHVLIVRNNWGCTTTLPVIVPEPANGLADILPQDSTIQLGESLQLFTTFSPYPASTITSYAWTPSLGLSCTDCANPLATPYNHLTNYTVTVTYNRGCVATANITVMVENKLPVFIPNSFSPNGDGNNDVFQIFGEGIKTVDLKIFNRWGEKVYESNNQFAGWDGTYRSEMQNPSVFAYTVKITFLDDKVIDRVGSITLIR